MKYLQAKRYLLLPGLFFGLLFSCTERTESGDSVGETMILPWQGGKKLAVSVTYDDGTVNQFKKAIPIMNDLGMKGTFYINTGEIPGSQYPARFIGRDILEIIKETGQTPTNADNLFERASAIRMVDTEGSVEIHNQAGALYEQGKVREACELIDEAYAKIKAIPNIQLRAPKVLDGERTTWEEIRDYAVQGHEFGVHTISHPRLAVMDEENLLYELVKCREDIERELGPEHTFSAECPFGTEDERVMEYALEEFEALRNRMPEEYLHEVNRWGDFDPAYDRKPYTQWQRGPLSKTTLAQKKEWIDEALTSVNSPWLVLVYHGIDGIGWEAQSSDSIQSYFEYIHDLDDKVWVGTFKEVTQYMRERMAANLTVDVDDNGIRVNLSHDLGDRYDFPLTLQTRVPGHWTSVTILQDGTEQTLPVDGKDGAFYVVYSGVPNRGEIMIVGQ
ncbi:polysaccharide deacetylase family protein [Negadavirga shengliensis]|uniref:Polysaccharide deacetylase family protein n=1 Tax=Negadavirga shengliensis TaxID=1389218 RepID=A0ABV9T4J5_9BACT